MKLAWSSKELRLAAPYFSRAEPILDAMKHNSKVRLLIGLNTATHPNAVEAVFSRPQSTIRFYTGRFHAKLYVFDKGALVGSANLTDGGFQSNREIVAWFTEPDDSDEIDEAKTIFETLWEGARALSAGTLDEFKRAWTTNRQTGSDPDAAIAAAVGPIEPPNVSTASHRAVAAQITRERLRRQIEEEYRPAFSEVGTVLAEEGLERLDVAAIDPPFRINRFLNWLRLTHVLGDTWKSSPIRTPTERRAEIVRFGRKWFTAADGRVYAGYAEGIRDVLAPFAEPSTLASATQDQVIAGLLGVHAFSEQSRFTEGGRAALPGRFWSQNNHDLAHVRETLGYLLYGIGDFVDRLHSVTTDPGKKLALFGKFCGLELCGTVKPSDCPPVNGRSAKALRFLGFDVSAD